MGNFRIAMQSNITKPCNCFNFKVFTADKHSRNYSRGVYISEIVSILSKYFPWKCFTHGALKWALLLRPKCHLGCERRISY